jgi:hypothetical protein
MINLLYLTEPTGSSHIKGSPSQCTDKLDARVTGRIEILVRCCQQVVHVGNRRHGSLNHHVGTAEAYCACYVSPGLVKAFDLCPVCDRLSDVTIYHHRTRAARVLRMLHETGSYWTGKNEKDFVAIASVREGKSEVEDCAYKLLPSFPSFQQGLTSKRASARRY